MWRKILNLRVMMGVLLSGILLTTSVVAAPLTMVQIYNYAKQEKIDLLKKVKGSVDTIGERGNTALCQSVKNRDYKSFYILKEMGASTRHPCINKMSEQELSSFNKGYNQWVASVKSGQSTAPIIVKDVAAMTGGSGLSVGGAIGIGIGAAALIGGGVALAAGGGGGGSSGPVDLCANVVCEDANSYCDAGVCVCKDGWGHHSSNRCWKDLVCTAHATQYQDNCVCDRGYGYYGTAECHATLECVHGEQAANMCSCQTGWVGSLCSDAAPCTGYTLSSCPANATSCSECPSGYTKKYKVDGCQEGWIGIDCSTPAPCPYTTPSCGQGYHETGETCKSGNNLYRECTPNICTGSTTDVAHCSNQEITCWSATTPYYTCHACLNGWTLSNNTCVANACTGYNLTSCPAGATGCDTCQSGTTTKYKIKGCSAGYDESNGTCVVHQCSGGSTSAVANCKTETTCQSASTVYHTCTACNNGYNLTNNSCPANACTGYNLTSCPAGATGCDTCQSGEIKKYKIKGCSAGYDESNGTCVVHQCSGGSTSAVANCKTETTCQSAATVYHTCTACNNGYNLTNNSCPANACTGYGLTSCPGNATSCSECQSGDTKKYKANGCKEGWTGTSCSTAATCTGYNLTSCPANAASCYECKSGNTTKYKVNQCAEGWEGSTCSTAKSCAGYELTQCPLGALTCKPCWSGETKKYKVTECDEGWHLSGSTCVADACSGYDLTSCPAADGAQSCDSCWAGYTKKYKVTKCRNGFTLSGGVCVENSCTGYTQSSCPPHATSCSECEKGDTWAYKVNGCEEGWYLSAGTCLDEPCTGYTLDSCPAHAECLVCKSGFYTKYKLHKCESGYYNNNGSCIIETCPGYSLTSCPTNATSCSSCQSGGTTKYKVDGCKSGWTGTSCSTAATCSGYDLTSCPTNATSCSTCKSGSATKYKVNGCKDGWTGTSCSTAATCPYNTTSCGAGYHETGKTCKSGNTTYKECTANTCNGGSTSAISNCKTETTCQSASTVYHTCTACNDGYTLTGNACPITTCTGGSTSHVSNCKAETTCQSGSTKYYTCTACNSGYNLIDNTCVVCPANYYSSNGACYACPANSTSPVNSVGANSCVCKSGYEKINGVCRKKGATRSPTTQSDFTNHTAYTQTNTLAPINAAKAYSKFIFKYSDGTFDYSALAPVKVVLDDTIGDAPEAGYPYLTHDAINWATDSDGNRDIIGGTNVQTTTQGVSIYHGLATASVIGAKWNRSDDWTEMGYDFWGVAPNAQIYALNHWRPTYKDGKNIYDEAFYAALDKQPRIWCLEHYSPLESSTINTSYTMAKEQFVYSSEFNSRLEIGKRGIVMVGAAGNDYNKNMPSYENAIGDYTWSEDGMAYSLKNLFITAVASTNKMTGNTLKDYSNVCGWAQEWCLTAPVGTTVAYIMENDRKVWTEDGVTYYRTTDFTQSIWINGYSGTSNAIPVISGSVAFLMGAYPYLTSQQVVEILFRTANKNVFAAGTWVNDGTWQDSFGNTYRTSKLYGHGMVDLGAATEPLGIMSLPTSTTASATVGDLNAIIKSPVAQTKLALPRTLNSALSVSMPASVMGLDDYNRPFAVKTTGLVTQAHRTDESFRRYFKSFMNRDRRTITGVPDKMSFEFTSSITDDDLLGMGVLDIKYKFNDIASLKFSYRSDILDEEKHFDKILANPFLNLTDSYGLTQELNLTKKLTFKFGGIFGKNGFYRGDEDLDEEYNRSAHAFMTEMDYKINHKLTLKAIGGLLSEKDAVLGINGTGALETDTSRTYFTGGIIEYYPISQLTLSAAYYYGQTNVPRTNSLVSFGNILSDGFAFDARYKLDEKRMFGLQFSSPLRIRKGIASLNIPTARDMYSDTVYYDTVRVGLKPTAREYDIGLYYTQETENYDWRGEFMTRFHPDHISGIKPDYRTLFGLSLKY